MIQGETAAPVEATQPSDQPWELVVRPLGMAARAAAELGSFGKEYVPSEEWQTAFHIFDLVTAATGTIDKDYIAFRYNVDPAKVDDFIRNQAEKVCSAYNATTIAQAFHMAVRQGDIVVRPRKKTKLPPMSPRWREIVKLATQKGMPNAEIAEQIGEERFLQDCQDMQAIFGCARSMVAILRSWYEHDLLEGQTTGVAFGLSHKKHVELVAYESDLITDRSIGLTNAQSGHERGVSEGTQKTRIKSLLNEDRFDANNTAEITAKAIVTGLLAVEDRPTHKPPTLRQLRILALVAQGKGNQQIAKIVGVSENTVKTHLRRMGGALGMGNGNRDWLVRRGFEARLLTILPPQFAAYVRTGEHVVPS